MRRLWILLMVAGVVTLHGVQVLSVDQGEHHATTAMAVEQVSGSGAGEGVTNTAPRPADVRPVSAWTTVDSASDLSPTGHGGTEYIGTVCLAVLLTGLAVLGAMMPGRGAAATTVSGRSVARRRPMGVFRLPRPPDLAELGLLRI